MTSPYSSACTPGVLRLRHASGVAGAIRRWRSIWVTCPRRDIVRIRAWKDGAEEAALPQVADAMVSQILPTQRPHSSKRGRELAREKCGTWATVAGLPSQVAA